MAERELEDLKQLLPSLLEALEALGFVSRYFYPPDFIPLMSAVGEPDAPLRKAHEALSDWSEDLQHLRNAVDQASELTLAAFDELRAARGGQDHMRAVYRALRHLPRAQEALYALASGVPPVSRFFLEPGVRFDESALARLNDAAPRQDVGIMHVGEPGARGAFSVYVPEYYTPDEAWPLVLAAHGGGGNGRSFLWSWLRDARSHGAILVAPTAIGDTWALFDPDEDSPNLARIVETVRAHWSVDPSRMLLTGMSDGGTFSYASGLEPASPFTHLAPVAASFHPVLAQMANPDRLHGLPIHIVHGALDWMFPINVAREANEALAAAGANVTYRELDDLSHCYPREINPVLLDWLNKTPGGVTKH